MSCWLQFGFNDGNSLVLPDKKPLSPPKLTQYHSIMLLRVNFKLSNLDYQLYRDQFYSLHYFPSVFQNNKTLFTYCISMVYCKAAVTPVLLHWMYCSLALSNRSDVHIWQVSPRHDCGDAMLRWYMKNMSAIPMICILFLYIFISVDVY